MNKLVALIVGGSLLCSATLFARLTPPPAPPANSTTGAWGAQVSNGVGLANGTPLANGSGDLVLIGTFNGLNNSQIAAASFSQLQAAWVQFGAAVIGAGNPGGAGSASDGYWTGVTTSSASTLGISGKAIYYWVLNAASFGAATQQGIFTSSASNWVFPNDTVTPQSFTTDLSDVPHNSTGILWGSFGTGTSRDGSSPLYNLALIAVPEPSTLALFGFALLAAPAVYLGRRRSK